ncbi:MAG: molybdopterin-binding protein [Thermoprotei archaeon]
MQLRILKVEEAVGKTLAYDVSLVTESFKGALLRRGHILTHSDVDVLKKAGHNYVYVYDSTGNLTNDLHEEEAVLKLGEYLAGSNVSVYLGEEGKAILKSRVRGLLKISSSCLQKINSTGVFVVVTRRKGVPVGKNDIVGIVDLIPLTVPKDYLDHLLNDLKECRPVIEVSPFHKLAVGVVVTGTEVFEGLIEDKASPVVKDKVSEYGGLVAGVVKVPDDPARIKDAVIKFLKECDAVIVTGGMSVDPTDLTPKSIAEVADEVVMYGIPIKPNTMSMVAYAQGKPIIGVSSAIIYYRAWNILDVLLPWVMAKEKISREYLVSLGEGGLTEEFLKGRGWH